MLHRPPVAFDDDNDVEGPVRRHNVPVVGWALIESEDDAVCHYVGDRFNAVVVCPRNPLACGRQRDAIEVLAVGPHHVDMEVGEHAGMCLRPTKVCRIVNNGDLPRQAGLPESAIQKRPRR